MKRYLSLTIAIVFLATICAAGEFRKWGVEDIEWGTGTWTSAGGVTSTRVPYPYSGMGGTDNSAVFDVRSFGAVGDGTTDDTTAIQNAIDNAGLVYGTVVFPSGTFKITSALTISKRVTIIGAGTGNDNTTAGTVITKYIDATGISVQASNTILSGFYLTSALDKTGLTADGIVVGAADASNGAGAVAIQDVTVHNQGGNGIIIKNGNTGSMLRVESNSNGGDGVHLDSEQTSAVNTNAWHITSLGVTSNVGYGLYIGDAVANNINVTAQGNTNYGVYVNYPANNITMYAESNTAGSIDIGANAYDCFIIGRMDAAPNIGNYLNYIVYQPQSGNSWTLSRGRGKLRNDSSNTTDIYIGTIFAQSSTDFTGTAYYAAADNCSVTVTPIGGTWNDNLVATAYCTGDDAIKIRVTNPTTDNIAVGATVNFKANVRRYDD